MFEVLLPVCLPPVFERLSSEPQDFVDSLEVREVIENCHDWDVANLRDLLAIRLVVLLGLYLQVNDEIS